MYTATSAYYFDCSIVFMPWDELCETATDRPPPMPMPKRSACSFLAEDIAAVLIDVTGEAWSDAAIVLDDDGPVVAVVVVVVVVVGAA